MDVTKQFRVNAGERVRLEGWDPGETLERMDPQLPALKIEPEAALRLLDGID